MAFNLFIGVDYSGAQTAYSRLPGLQVYAGTHESITAISPSVLSLQSSVESQPGPDGRGPKSRNWSRQEVAQWLVQQVRSGVRFIAGVDHGFSFPIDYFQRYRLESWPAFLQDFVHHWPTDQPGVTVDSIRDNQTTAAKRIGANSELRLTERWTSSAKSVFLFDVQGSVAKSTHAGLPWLAYLRDGVGEQLHFWPFDGWAVPAGKSVIAEVYPSIFRNRYPRSTRTVDQQDAYAIARWLSESDHHGWLPRYFAPPLTADEEQLAMLEGWILGIA